MKVTLTKAQIEQLLWYAKHRDHGQDAGWYYGNAQQFEKRHEQIKTALYAALVRPILDTTKRGER